MSEQGHGFEGSPRVDLVGYVLCGHHQNHWVRSEVASRTGGVCPEAFRIFNHQRLTEIELVGRGSRIKVPLSRSRKRPNRHITSGRAERKKAADKAKHRARKRLAAMFPDLYDILVAEERAEMGLEPWPVEMAIRGDDPDVEIGFAALIAELDDREVDTT